MGESQNLVYLLSSLETGGAQTGMFRILDGLSGDRFDTTVVSLQCPEPQLCERFPAHVDYCDLGIENKVRIDRLQPLLEHLTDADILVCSLYHATIIGRVLGHLVSVPRIINWQHNSRFQGFFRPSIYELTNRFSDVIIADSEAVADVLHEQYGDTVSVETVPIAGIDTARFKPSMTANGGNLTVGTLGTLTAQKNHDQVLAVAERLPDVEFHVGGAGPRLEELETIAERRELTNVYFHGFVDDVPLFLSEQDIYFQPSHFEGLCITVIEAMACGLPVVASRVGGIENSVVEGETGFLTSSDDTKSFVKHIKTLLENPEMRKRFSRAGRNRVESKYSKSVLVERFESVLDSV